MIYIACFAVSALCAYLDTRNEQKKHIGLFGWLAILLPAILAGLRDVSVGTDTMVYAAEFSKIAGHTFTQFVSDKSYMEIGFRFLYFIISRFTGNPAWALFVVHLFILFFVYKALKDNGAGKYTWLGLTVFHLMFFSSSLNLIRQYMAAALILWGFKYVQEEKLLKWLAVIISAALFHVTAIIAIFIYFLYQIYVIRSDGSYRNGTAQRIRPELKLVISVCILVAALLVFLFARPLIRIVHEITGKFRIQANTIRDYFAIDLYDITHKLLFLIPFVLFRKSEANANGDCDYYAVLIAVCMILSQLNMVSYNAGRISYPFWIQIVLAIPFLVSKPNNKTVRIVLSTYYLLICGWIYIDNIIVKGYTEVWPYTSEILGIK